MKLTITTTFIAASMFALPISFSGVASGMIDHGQGNQPNNQGGECTTFVHHSFEDVGVHSCSSGEMCVNDSTSSVGGRCIVVSGNEAAFDSENQRKLNNCIKCSGSYACHGTDSSKIGCGSCIGHAACYELPCGVTVGENSCVGEIACSVSKGEFNLNNE